MKRRAKDPPSLPTGTVTFLFTDIEGSTRLLSELGDAYEPVLGRHTKIIRRAIADHDGLEVNTEGDAFFAVFTSPLDALEAAVQAQHLLDAEAWSDGAAVRVRMGIHSGNGRLGGDDYIGMDVHLAARVASSAHGGQVLVSDATRALVAHTLPDGFSMRELGRYHLKGIPDPERLYQLEGPGLTSRFPPLRRPAEPSGNLPGRPSRIVGRAIELAQIERLLEQTRLLTLTGAGGSGKTTLALEIARRRAADAADGAWFIDLGNVLDTDSVRSEIAHGLGLLDGAVGPAADRLEGFVAERDLFIVIDNFEQVIGAAGEVAALHDASKHSTILVTSRMPLHLAAEHEFAVRPLGLEPAGAGETSPAVELFVDRARRVRPELRLDAADLGIVADICRLLDGLPLAIELVATRVGGLPLALIRDRLAADRSLPGGGPRDLPARQATMEITVDWSRDLLANGEQQLFDRLAVFMKTFDLEQLEQVAGGPEELGVTALDGIYELVERSLVMRLDDDVGGVRFGLLETTRARALAHLSASGEAVAMRERHARAYAALAARAAKHIPGPEQAYWLDRLAADETNLREAMSYAIATMETDTALALVGDLWRCWLAIGRLADMRELVRAALSLPGADVPTRSRLKVLEAAGGVAYWSGDLAGTLSAYEERMSLAAGLGDASEEGRAWLDLYYARIYGGDVVGAGVAIEAARRRFGQAGDASGISRAEGAQDTTLLMSALHDLPSVRSEIEATARLRESSDDPSLRRIGHVLRSVLALLQGDPDGALEPAAAALRHDLAARDSAEAILDLQTIAVALGMADRSADAAVMEGAVAAAVERYGVRPVFAGLLERTLFADRGVDPSDALGRARYEEAVDRGRRMSLAEAADLAEQLVEPRR